jgi:hypothetical protein
MKVKKNKKFDCVRMKWEIQQEILKEFSSVEDAKAHKAQMSQVINSPLLGPFYKKMRVSKQTAQK